ncbi:MAG: PCRF domain-containing protein, partial [Bacilli bacterium]|nr:PCRF domain-containing protein [Bacilli bacterium]
MNKDDFWNNRQESEQVIKEINDIEKTLESLEELKQEIQDNIELLNLLKNEYDEETKNLIESNLDTVANTLNTLEIKLLLNEPYDKNNAILEIHSGAGGTEACDWAMMLYRMYMRWCEKKGYQVEIVDMQNGEEAGIKSATILVKGNYAVGYLKSEKGVHRLVRLSPFDSNSRRHTSFASINITPLFDDNEINIDIKDSDLKIDVYRSSGAGGQSVNTTDSAVRITHLPT